MSSDIIATYRVVTPMFCAGADQRRAELRMSSFKGVLRFWWRALAWSRLDGDLEAIRCQEAIIFGSSSRGQSAVALVELAYPHPTNDVGSHLSRTVGQGARYLGYGVMEEGSNQRGFLRPDFNFTVRMKVRDPEGKMESVTAALTALGVFGGMGARSRKGFGSVSLQSLMVDGEETWRGPESIAGLGDRIKGIMETGRQARFPEYTALSEQSRCVLLTSDYHDSLKLLDAIGGVLKEGISSTQREERVAFGLPRRPRSDRRASPLFIHIHECSDSLVAVLAFLPARFLPNAAQTPVGDVYRPIHALLDRLLDRDRRNKQFVAVEVKP